MNQLETRELDAREIPEFLLSGDQPQLCQCETCRSMQRPILTAVECREVNALFGTLEGLMKKRRVRVLRELDEEEARLKRGLVDVFKRRVEILGARA